MPYRIYRNLHKECFSIQSWVPGKGWRVTDYAVSLKASKITFRVYEAGRQKVLDTGRKTPHAYVVAQSWERVTPSTEGARASYNPRKGPDFTVDHTVMTWADEMELRDTSMYVIGSWG